MVPLGAANAVRLIAIIEDLASCLPEEARATLLVLIETKTRLDSQMAKINAEISWRAKENEVARRLMTIPGIGPLIATALVALAPPPETFRRGRDFAVWLGLVPRQHSTGGKQKLGATTKMGERSLRHHNAAPDADRIALCHRRDGGGAGSRHHIHTGRRRGLRGEWRLSSGYCRRWSPAPADDARLPATDAGAASTGAGHGPDVD